MSRVILILMVALSARAATVTFAWDPPPDAPVGLTYFLKWGQASGAYVANSQPTAGFTQSITNLFAGTNYVVAVSWLNGVQSDPSNELLVIVKPPKPGNLRVPVQGAGAVTGPWTNIALIEIPFEFSEAMAFFRAVPVIERPDQ